MAGKNYQRDIFLTPKSHIRQLIDWLAQGVYEKEQIIAMALLCAVTGENIFLLGPPGTGKSLVSARLKGVFKDAKSFDYLMSRFSTPDEIFGPISISRLKNEDKYERLVEGFLPSADVVFLDEIWKAGPSIQNTLLTAINEHIYHNGSHTLHIPMKVLIAASNELPAKDEGLEALWDRFLVRMVSNCIESESAFFKMLKVEKMERKPIDDSMAITKEIYERWQSESQTITLSDEVTEAIKSLRKAINAKEKAEGNQLLYYVSDRRWKKAFRLMQAAAYLNDRPTINLSDFLLLIHCFWNDVECRETIIQMVLDSILESLYRKLTAIERSVKQIIKLTEPKSQPMSVTKTLDSSFVEYNYFYYKIENYPDGECYVSKWDYTTLNSAKPSVGIRYFDTAQKTLIVHALLTGRPFDNKPRNGDQFKKVSIQKCSGGLYIDGVPYAFVRKAGASHKISDGTSMKGRVDAVRQLYGECVEQWHSLSVTPWAENIFLSISDIKLLKDKLKEADSLIKETDVKIKNLTMLL